MIWGKPNWAYIYLWCSKFNTQIFLVRIHIPHKQCGELWVSFSTRSRFSRDTINFFQPQEQWFFNGDLSTCGFITKQLWNSNLSLVVICEKQDLQQARDEGRTKLLWIIRPPHTFAASWRCYLRLYAVCSSKFCRTAFYTLWAFAILPSFPATRSCRAGGQSSYAVTVAGQTK